jgi:hypothetical protein
MKLVDAFISACTGPWATGPMDTQYRITKLGETTILRFEGSVSKSDWVNNFDFPAVPYKNSPVRWYAHRGFVKTWKAVRDEIMPLINKDEPLLILGYSRGGALATIAHEDFVFNGYNVITFTFGAPRVLWLAPNIVRDRFDNVTNIAASGDIVTKIPPKFFGYTELDTLVLGEKRMLSVKAHFYDNYLKVLADE